MSAEKRPVIVWFRRDLRLKDNPALVQAAKQKAPILFLYTFNRIQIPGRWGLPVDGGCIIAYKL